MTQRSSSSIGRRLWPVLLCAASLALAPGFQASGHAQAQAHAQAAAHAQPQPAKPGTPAPSTAASAADGVININTASAEEFDKLPGVGPSRAAAIVTLRTKLKRFEHLEDLMRVKGIGRVTFRKLRPLLRLDGPSTLTGKTHTPAHAPAEPQH